jgi:hypothetical protein
MAAIHKTLPVIELQNSNTTEALESIFSTTINLKMDTCLGQSVMAKQLLQED